MNSPLLQEQQKIFNGDIKLVYKIKQNNSMKEDIRINHSPNPIN